MLPFRLRSPSTLTLVESNRSHVALLLGPGPFPHLAREVDCSGFSGPSLSDDNRADIDQMNLPAVAAVRRIDRNIAAIPTPTRMRVTPLFSVTLDWRAEVPQRMACAGPGVKQIGVLVTLSIRIGIAQNPAIAGHVGAMVILGHNTVPHNFKLIAAILVKIEAATQRRARGPRQDVPRISPDEMRDPAVIIHDCPTSAQMRALIEARRAMVFALVHPLTRVRIRGAGEE